MQLRLLLYGRAASERYKRFTLTKRSGGKRIILAPAPDLKLVQRKLATQLADIYPLRDVVYGFATGRSIVGNAGRHLLRRHVLNVDLSDFFPTINYGRVRGLFISLGAGRDAATTLAHICCHEDALPQGAPTSPILSNMICAKMDRELLALAKQHHCVYTRYADDLTFSKKTGVFPIELNRISWIQIQA
jgi:RNA-directed DNA polymerase